MGGSEDDFDFGDTSPHWRCEECGVADQKKPMPPDRAKFYAKETQPQPCRACGSQALMPVGW